MGSIIGHIFNINKVNDNENEVISDKSDEPLIDKSDNHSKEQNDKLNDKSNDQPIEQSNDAKNDQADEQPIDQTDGQADEQVSEQPFIEEKTVNLPTNIITLNQGQTRALNYIKTYLEDDTKPFLLLGAAGTGKTSTIINVFNNTNHKIAFCAFTNKATQVLKNASKKFNVQFTADFSTIHSLLALEPVYGSNYDDLKFKFDKTKIDNLKNYSVIIIDECSTISKDLYEYLCEAHDYICFKYEKKLKFIFLGDFWQLPPVAENSSCIFDRAIGEKWPVSKLTEVMRSNNDNIAEINKILLKWIEVIKNPRTNQKDYSEFVYNYPYCMFPKTMGIYLDNYDAIVDKYFSTWEKQPDVVVLTYSHSNATKINKSIQNRLDAERYKKSPNLNNVVKKLDETKEADLTIDSSNPYNMDDSYNTNASYKKPANKYANKFAKEELIIFQVGDRCCLERPIELSTIVYKTAGKPKNTASNTVSNIVDITSETDQYLDNLNFGDSTRYAKLDKRMNVSIYNGEIFDIIYAEEIMCSTPLNKFLPTPYFKGQILGLVRINDPDRTIHEVMYIPWVYVKPVLPKIKAKLRNKDMFNIIMNEYLSTYARLTYGYCITIYKAQGSEWHTTIVNLSSIKYSVAPRAETDPNKIKQLFKTTYTAMTRSTNAVHVFYF